MAINYPNSLDVFTNPTATSKRNNPSLAGEMSDKNDAVVALETKLGVNNSAVTTSIDYLLKSTSSTDPGHKHTAASLTGITTVPTGGIIMYPLITPPSGFINADGSAVSRVTYATLFALFGTTFGTGDGSTTFNVPNLQSRTALGAGTGTKIATFVSRSSNTITVSGLTNTSINEFQTGQLVLYLAPSGAMTGLTTNTTYYVIRVSNSSFSLASSLANAQSGTPISLSSDGSGIQTFTKTFTASTIADTGGEETHAMNSSELLAHTHSNPAQSAAATNNFGILNAATDSSTNSAPRTTSSTGGNQAMNNMSPFIVLNYIIKT